MEQIFQFKVELSFKFTAVKCDRISKEEFLSPQVLTRTLVSQEYRFKDSANHSASVGRI